MLHHLPSTHHVLEIDVARNDLPATYNFAYSARLGAAVGVGMELRTKVLFIKSIE
ncbi:MAG: hypothetical protein AOA65_1826 [Candidatus Bathyarchaeota archaeon BA1]|nr:MAG: hypothetical protein AOA65_1826 [Candidatus Bathyarchaeota archaeon BA1]